MNEAFLSIGSNMGDRQQYLTDAIRSLRDTKKIIVEKISSIYETAPVGLINQADFLNLVVRLSTSLKPLELLDVCQKIEQKLDRERKVRWGPRTIDLDILLYNHDNIEMENLSIPHPRMLERAFVLIPLLEIAPESRHPVTGEKFLDVAAVHDEGVKSWGKIKGNE